MPNNAQFHFINSCNNLEMSGHGSLYVLHHGHNEKDEENAFFWHREQVIVSEVEFIDQIV